MLSYPSTITLSTRTLHHLAGRIRRHHQQQGTRWRRLTPHDQALLALAHLRNGDTYARLAAGFGISTTTAWRYVQEVITLLAAAAPDLDTAMRRIRRLPYVVLDGTLIPIDRVADQKPYYSGKHRRHGMNVQTIASPQGEWVWASPALPGSTHDLTAARTHGIIEALDRENIDALADKAYLGAPDNVHVPYRNERGRKLSAGEKTANRGHARLRAIGERANATLKQWKILTKLRSSPHRTTPIIQAIMVLDPIDAGHQPG
ncbi:IS5/IS1182 family transposase [Catenuloplanes japonicus]|uniref:IS5/IS1182 family transposase n=1 Tax=Catenuloplanes japonicus TaxID=33876 RepID=UPI00052577EC|nr:IS5/IS1182 family transposase [Catenuloplanes japonicus]